MGRLPADCKEYKGKNYYPSSYLAKKLYLSPERSRAVLQDYENISELGTNPKFYDKQLLDKIIDDYNNDKIKSKALQKRKEKERAKKIRLEEERAKAEKLTYESSEPMERLGPFFLANQMKEKLVSTMLNNLFAALGSGGQHGRDAARSVGRFAWRRLALLVWRPCAHHAQGVCGDGCAGW